MSSVIKLCTQIAEHVCALHSGSMDNPTYDEGINIGPLATEVNHVGNGENIQNPDYSDVGPSFPNTTNPTTQNIHEGLYSVSTMAGEMSLYENTQ